MHMKWKSWVDRLDLCVCVCVYAHARECVHASVQRGACIHMCVKEKHIELHQIVKTAEECFFKKTEEI